MSTYVMSDVHGRLDLFEKMLKKIHLTDKDMLYVLGDTIDRGGGLAVLRKLMEMEKEGKAYILPGNHEVFLFANSRKHLPYDKMFNELYRQEQIQKQANNRMERSHQRKQLENPGLLDLFGTVADIFGGVRGLTDLTKSQQAVTDSLKTTLECSQYAEWDSWHDLDTMNPLDPKEREQFLFDLGKIVNRERHKLIEVGGKHYILVHGGLVEKEVDEKLWLTTIVREPFYQHQVSPEVLASYGAPVDTTVIFGHTTTRDLSIMCDHTYIAPNKIWFDQQHHDKIGIDAGAAYPNGQLACLRLDDMEEFYVRNDRKYITPLDTYNDYMKQAENIIESYCSVWPSIEEKMEV